MPSFSQWQASNQYPAGTAPFRVAETFGPVPRGRDYLDDLRMNWRRTPNAEYPDGYLGTIPSRRGDRLMDGLKARMNNRPYTRGIHKGERIDAQDYFWPPEFNLWALGCRAGQSCPSGWTCPRFFPPGIGKYLEDERYPTDRKVGPRGVPVGARNARSVPQQAPLNPDRIPMLRGQAPPWASASGVTQVWPCPTQVDRSAMPRQPKRGSGCQASLPGIDRRARSSRADRGRATA